jgi:hypothetical protein
VVLCGVDEDMGTINLYNKRQDRGPEEKKTVFIQRSLKRRGEKNEAFLIPDEHKMYVKKPMGGDTGGRNEKGQFMCICYFLVKIAFNT